MTCAYERVIQNKVMRPLEVFERIIFGIQRLHLLREDKQ